MISLRQSRTRLSTMPRSLRSSRMPRSTCAKMAKSRILTSTPSLSCNTRQAGETPLTAIKREDEAPQLVVQIRRVRLGGRRGGTEWRRAIAQLSPPVASRPDSSRPSAARLPLSRSNRSSARPTLCSMISSTRCGLSVEGRHRRHDDGAGFGCLRHRADMAEVKRRLTDHENEAAPLLQCHVGGAGQQVRCIAIGDFGKAADRAWRDQHAHRAKRTARDRCADILDAVHDAREILHLAHLERQFMRERHHRGARHHQMRLDAERAQHAQRRHTIGRARCTADPDDQPTDRLATHTEVPAPRDSAGIKSAICMLFGQGTAPGNKSAWRGCRSIWRDQPSSCARFRLLIIDTARR